MKNKSLITKIIVIAIVVIIVIFLVVKLVGFIDEKVHEDKPDSVIPEIQEQIDNASGKIQKVNTPNELYQVKSCILKYYLNYAATYGKNTITEVSGEEYNAEEYKNSTYNMLAPKYIDKNNITVENINSQSNDILEPEIEIYSVYSLSNYNGVAAYFTNGKVRDSLSHNGIEFNIILVLDDNNQTFEIYFNDYTDEIDYSELKENEKIDFELPDKVESRTSNVYGITSAKYEDISEDYFNLVRRLLLSDPEIAYSLLNDDMKDKYGSYDSFKGFIDDNYKTLFLLTYGNYYVKNNDGNMIFKAYNKDDTICINIYFDAFSSFKFDIEGLE